MKDIELLMIDKKIRIHKRKNAKWFKVIGISYALPFFNEEMEYELIISLNRKNINIPLSQVHVVAIGAEK